MSPYLLTGIAAITRRPPRWGLSVDAAHTLLNGFVFCGDKVERNLGLRYKPIQNALREAIASYRLKWHER